MKNIKKIIMHTILVAFFAVSYIAVLPVSAAGPNWDVTGNYVMDQHYTGIDNTHMSLVQDNLGNLTGSGKSGAYTWVIDTGYVSGNLILFKAHYTATDDAVTPLTVLKISGTIAPNGTMSGTWVDTYQGIRIGDWTSTGVAILTPVLTMPATNVITNTTLNGINGGMDAGKSLFWVSTSTFSTATLSLPAGVYSTASIESVAANTAFSASLASVVGMPTVTPNTTYYFAAWSNMDGKWYPGEVLNFTTAESQNPSTVKVTIIKYIDGVQATAVSSNNSSFVMNATWNAQNIGADNSLYKLSTIGFNNPNAYQATTSNMTVGADYSTNETTDGLVVGSACVVGGTPYALDSYSTGDTLIQADQATPTKTFPVFTNMTSDKFVIVRNIDCSKIDLEGTVIQGEGVLNVDSITVVKSSSMANGTYEDGWKYIFHITVPNNEPKLVMKFADWINGVNIVPVADNMRISSAQADNTGATIALITANTYSAPPLKMVADLNPTIAGKQVDVNVEVKIPIGTILGLYTTTYGVQSTP